MLCCKSCQLENWRKKHTVTWKKSCTSWWVLSPIICRVLYIPGGAGLQLLGGRVPFGSCGRLLGAIGQVTDSVGCFQTRKGWQKRGEGDCDGVGPWGLKLSAKWRLNFWLPDLPVCNLNHCCCLLLMLLDYWICSFCFALVTMVDLKPKICTVMSDVFAKMCFHFQRISQQKKVFIHMYCLLFYMDITFNQVYTVYPHLQYIVLRHLQVKALEKKKWTSQLSVNQPESGPQISFGMGGNGSEPSEPWWMLWSCYPVFTSLLATTRMIWLDIYLW